MIMAFHSHGGAPIDGWCYSGILPMKMDENWGYPHDFGGSPTTLGAGI